MNYEVFTGKVWKRHPFWKFDTLDWAKLAFNILASKGLVIRHDIRN